MWAGGKVSTHQDLSDLFVVRSVEQYLAKGGRFGFVMPAAVLSRRQYEGFRKGYYEALGVTTAVGFDTAWDLRRVTPDIFPAPSSVVFGKRSGAPAALPAEVLAYSGRIAPRGTRWTNAEERLTRDAAIVERGSDDDTVSVYANRFYQGATILPCVMTPVEELPAGPLGTPTGNRRVGSLRSSLEKKPWKELDDLEGLVEEQFIYQTYLGAPSRLSARLSRSSPSSLDPETGCSMAMTQSSIPYPNLAAWWRRAEQLWEDHRGAEDTLSAEERLLPRRPEQPALRPSLIASSIQSRATGSPPRAWRATPL